MSLIEDDMAGDEDTVVGAIETAVPLVLGGVAEEDASCRARGEFMWGSGCDVGVAETPKHAERRVVRVSAMEEEEGGVIMTSTT